MENEGKIVVEYAGFWRRLAAFLLDGIVVSGINWILLAPWRWAFSFSRPWDPIDWIWSSFYHFPMGSISVVIAAIFFVIFWIWRGQTPGKIIMNIKVLKDDGTPVTPSIAIIRFLGYIICFLTLGIGFFILAFDERRQGLHDKLSSTVVIKIPAVKIGLTEASMS